MLNSTDDAYLAALHDRVERGVRDAGSFAALLGQLQGADPVVAVAALESLAGTDPKARVLLEEMRTTKDGPVAVTPEPVAHPLDFAWHFTAATAQSLVRRLDVATAPGDQIVHLGTPTVHAMATCRSDRQHVLLDRDTRMVETANAACSGSAVPCDLLREDPPPMSASAAVLDPPWYPAEAAAFMNAAARVTQPGAVTLMAVPALLTRPGVQRDRAALIESAAEDGYDLIDTETAALRYRCPAFERAALAAAGLGNPPEDWRRADLLVFSRTSAPAPAPRRVSGETWEAFEIAGLPVRVRSEVEPSGDQLIQSVVAGDVLPSVSRREPARIKAALWTSRNRVFASSSPPRLRKLVAAVARGRTERLDGDERAAGQRLVSLLRNERSEHGLTA